MRRTWLLLPLLLAALSVAAQPIQTDVEIGYRWLDLKGNEDMYRTQINERSGLLLRAATFAHTTENDFLRFDATDLGVGPAGALRLQAGRGNAYRFTLRYRRTSDFSALPAFANPLLGRGIVPGQHTYDRTRNLADADLEILLWSKITPFVGVTWNRYEGPGTSTYHVGQDEFLLRQELNDTDREVRVGAGFEVGPVQGSITQGWRHFRGRETLTLAPGAGSGNNLDPVLGRPITASSITRNDRTDVDTPFTSLYLVGQATSRVRLIGNFSRFAADGDTDGSESVAGSLASFALGRFFNGISEEASTRAKNTTWRSGARADVAFSDGVDFTAGYRREHRDLDGSALIRTLYLQSITFGGADPRDVEVVLNATNALEREESIVDAAVTVRPAGPLALRVGLSRADSEVTVTPDLSEIVVPGGQGGTFERSVRTLLLDGSYTAKGLTLAAALHRDSASDPILRTDFIDRDRYRLRALYKAPRWVRVGVTAENTRQSNDRPDIAYDANLRNYVADLEVTPIEAVALRASASRFRADSSILYRRPENLQTDTSIHQERGKSWEGGVGLTFPRVTLDGSLSRFDNDGTLPFKLDRSRVRATFPIFTKLGIAAEWSHDKYRETALALADYEADRYGLYLRLTP